MPKASVERFRLPTCDVKFTERKDLLTQEQLEQLDELVSPADLPSEVPIAPTTRPWGYGDLSLDPED